MSAVQEKVLTVRQPFAAAILFNEKPVENRTWKTDYRGRLFIHAGLARVKPTDLELVERLTKHPYRVFHDPKRHRDYFGHILGFTRLTGIHHATTCDNGDGTFCSPWALADNWHWEIGNGHFMRFQRAQGRLSLWNLPADYIPNHDARAMAVNS